MFTPKETKILTEALNQYKAKLTANSEECTVSTTDGATLLEFYQDKFKTAQNVSNKIKKYGKNA